MTQKSDTETNILASAFAAADAGAMFETTLTPLVAQGMVHINYNWLYSALCVFPGQGNGFKFTVNKVNDTQISLSPTEPYAGMRLYASVRPDWAYFVQVQAPGSADWITRAQGDEMIDFLPQPLTLAAFKGLNAQYLSVNSGLSVHDGESAFKIQSNSDTINNASNWHMGIQRTCQPHLNLPLEKDLDQSHCDQLIKAGKLENNPEAVAFWQDHFRQAAG